MTFLDTETCGLHGPVVLLQWAEGDGEIHLHEVWRNSAASTISLIERIASGEVCGFNLAFDWFHLCQLYTTLLLLPDKEVWPEDCVEQYAELEPIARDGPCLKPKAACDIMLHARKGPYQSTMDRGDIRIKRIPTPLAWELAKELEARIPLKDIYFARRKDKRLSKWQVYDVQDADGEDVPDFKDIVLKFAPSSALKALAVDALGVEQDSILLFTDVGVERGYNPTELGYAPFAKAIGSRHDWRGAWPEVIRHHVDHWAYSKLGRKYAALDVDYTRRLYAHFGSPPPGDDDSELACMVGAVRWKGYRVDLDGLQKLRDRTLARQSRGDFKIPTAPKQARYYVSEHMTDAERLGAGAQTVRDFEVSTKKVLLQDIAKWQADCPDCLQRVNPQCPKCGGTGLVRHQSAIRAQEVLDARQAAYEANFYDKLLLAGRFHVSLSVIGALSSRMGGGGSAAGVEGGGFAGGDGLNAQGVKKTKEVRRCFPLAFEDCRLSGGDFAGFEVTIAEAVYNDANLRRKLLTCERCDGQMEFVKERNDFICKSCGSRDGKKIHALFGVHVFPEHTYESLKATTGTADDKYTKAKSGIFAMFYGGNEHTLADRLGVPVEVGVKALAAFHREFPGVRKFQQDIYNDFCSMRQVGGIGSRVEWHEPADYRETMFGFRRYFTLENQICRALFKLANDPPKAWREMRLKVERRAGRVQTAGGALQTALFAAAFAVQQSSMRAAANHDIQSAGATATKLVQRKVWDVQPCGANPWIVQPMNIHDEIMCPVAPEYADRVKEVVVEAVESIRSKIPLIKMDWAKDLKTWADK